MASQGWEMSNFLDDRDTFEESKNVPKMGVIILAQIEKFVKNKLNRRI